MPSSAFKNLPPGTTISRSPGKITIIRRPMNPAPAAPLLPKRVVYVSKRRFAAKKTPTTPLPPQRVPTVGPTSPLIAPDLSPFWQPHLKIIKRKGDRRFQEFLQLLRDERDNWNAPTTNSSGNLFRITILYHGCFSDIFCSDLHLVFIHLYHSIICQSGPSSCTSPG